MSSGTSSRAAAPRPRCRAALAVSALVLAVSAPAFGAFRLRAALSAPAPGSAEEIRFDVPAGASARDAAENLRSAGLVRSAFAFRLLARSKRAVIKAGSYLLSPGMDAESVLAVLHAGKSLSLSVSVPEGFTVNKIAALLEKRGVCPAEEFRAACRDESLLAEFAVPAPSFQGYLFPDTYFFPPASRAERAVRVMAENFFAKLALVPGAENLSPEELFRAVTLASIVEREYRVPDEAPLIAGVFANRLREGWGLYSCATVEFVLTEIQGKPHPEVITLADTRLDDPYNTYRRRGLPPGPIASPGLTALAAAVNPAPTRFFYFRLEDADSGRHHFSADFSEHIEAGKTLAVKREAGAL